MISRLAFYPTLLFNVVMEKCTSRQWYSRIDDHVILGALPFKSMTEQLVKKEHVTGVLSLNEDYELKYFVNSKQEWEAVEVEQMQIPTQDIIATPSLASLQSGVKFILKHRDKGGCVYVHCKAGRTRSATAVACYLITLHKWDVERTVQYITSTRPHVWLRDQQLKTLQQYYEKEVT